MMSMGAKPQELGLRPSFGFGDRLGVATPGHLQALLAEGGPIKGIFAQQSIREMARTQRQPLGVMEDATSALEQLRFSDICGADADHLKTKADVELTAKAGFTFFTIDPSEHVDQQADNYDASQVASKFAEVEPECLWVAGYLDKKASVPDGPEIVFDKLTLQRAVVKYGRAVSYALTLAAHIRAVTKELGQGHEIELSVDETEQPTTFAEHYLIADQLRLAGVKLVSLAPRFIGDLEKGVDYKGDLVKLEASLEQHAAIARHLGPYKLSLHSGSDKISMYPAFARATKGLFHVKTAGTSYLEALRVAARHDEPLFRSIVEFSRERYDVDKATYHVSATVAQATAPAEIFDVKELEREYLECWEDVAPGLGFTKPERQILHCTFGSVLCHDEYGQRLKTLLQQQPETYSDILTDHFGRHLKALCSGLQ